MTSFTVIRPEPAKAAPPAQSPHEVLLTLLQIEREIRQAETLQALQFCSVNSPRRLLEYQQAILWNEADGVVALSGVSSVDRQAPFVRWLEAWLRETGLQKGSRTGSAAEPQVQTEWQQWLPEQLWLQPLPISPAHAAVTAKPPGMWLLLARSKPWNKAELSLLDELGECLGHAFSALQPRRRWSILRRRWLLAGLLGLLLLIPVRQTVTTSVEVVPLNPVLVRVALEGVIERFHVEPNQAVVAGQPLFELDPTKLQGSIDVARNALTVAEADFRQTAQQALSDPRAKALLVVRSGEVERRQRELAYLEQLGDRLKVVAPVAGIAVFNDANDWLGRAVSVGEKVVDIADPEHVEFQIHLPVDDMLPLPEQAHADIYLNVAPDQALPAKVRYQGYQAEPTAEGILAYRLKAALAEGTKPPRVGLRGVARLQGERVALGYWLFRRPLSWLRQSIGNW